MSKYVTEPKKTGHVGTNYTPSHNKSFLSAATEYLWPVICTIKPTKCLMMIENFRAIKSH